MNKKDIAEWVVKLSTPVLIATFGYLTQNAIKEKDVRVALVQTSIKILSEGHGNDKIPMRKWAIDIINNYSEVKFDEDSTNYLVYNIPFSTKVQIRDNTITPEALITDDASGLLEFHVIRENSSFGPVHADLEKLNNDNKNKDNQR